jgi:molybdenum cofactor biosynthesis protein B
VSADEPLGAWVITVSDRCFRGEAEDLSGPAAEATLTAGGFRVTGRALVPDDHHHIVAALRRGLRSGSTLVVTTGGTGLAARDVTPQATATVIDFEVPGLAEEMRRAGQAKTPMSILSRGLAGVRGRSLVLNLPGSPAGARESLEAVLPTLEHAARLLRGEPHHPHHTP